MANGFIDGVGYPMNGGMAAGFAYGQKMAEEKRRKGLASGFAGYINAKDEAEKKAYLSQIAQNNPQAAMDIYNNEQAIARQDRLTPYQTAQLDLQRQQLERQGQLTQYQQAQLENQRANAERQNKLDQLALEEKAQAKEKEAALGDALYRYQTAKSDEDRNVALADVYRISPDFAKGILKKQKEAEEKAWTTDKGRMIGILSDSKEPQWKKDLVRDLLMAEAQNPQYKGQIAYNSALGKQYAAAGLPYGGDGQIVQGIVPQGQVIPMQAQPIPTAASLAQDKKRAEEAIDLEFSPQKKTAEAEAKKYAEDLDAVRTAEANYPQLEANVNRLRELAPIATFTKAGKTRDFVAKEFFGSTTDGAKARAELESIVNNAVLPLLKQTFGAAFTAEEGLRLQKTLANPDASDIEKIAELDTFINQKKAEIETKRRKLKLYEKKGGNYLLEDNVSEQQKEPTREELEAELRRRGLI